MATLISDVDASTTSAAEYVADVTGYLMATATWVALDTSTNNDAPTIQVGTGASTFFTTGYDTAVMNATVESTAQNGSQIFLGSPSNSSPKYGMATIQGLIAGGYPDVFAMAGSTTSQAARHGVYTGATTAITHIKILSANSNNFTAGNLQVVGYNSFSPTLIDTIDCSADSQTEYVINVTGYHSVSITQDIVDTGANNDAPAVQLGTGASTFFTTNYTACLFDSSADDFLNPVSFMRLSLANNSDPRYGRCMIRGLPSGMYAASDSVVGGATDQTRRQSIYTGGTDEITHIKILSQSGNSFDSGTFQVIGFS